MRLRQCLADGKRRAGYQAGRQADEALGDPESTSSGRHGAAIAQATQNQARQTKIVAGAIQRIALNVRQMARSATIRQAIPVRSAMVPSTNALTETVATAGLTGSRLAAVIDAINEITETPQVSGAQERQKQNQK